MSHRHTLARGALPFVVCLGLAACGSRSDLTVGDLPLGSDAGPRDAGGALVVPRDAGPGAVDGGGGADASAGECEATTRALEIQLEPVSTATLCAYGHHEGVSITQVFDEPVSNGIRMRADFCPFADRDCRCDIVVANTGPLEVARLPFPRDNLAVDVDRLHVVVRKSPTCRCDGCGCDMFLGFLATHEDPDTARDLPPDIAFARGSVACPTASACDRTDTWRLRVRTLGYDVELDEGTQQTLDDVVTVRNVADAVGFDVCAACADCGAVRGSFLAWVDSARAGP